MLNSHVFHPKSALFHGEPSPLTTVTHHGSVWFVRRASGLADAAWAAMDIIGIQHGYMGHGQYLVYVYSSKSSSVIRISYKEIDNSIKLDH